MTVKITAAPNRHQKKGVMVERTVTPPSGLEPTIFIGVSAVVIKKRITMETHTNTSARWRRSVKHRMPYKSKRAAMISRVSEKRNPNINASNPAPSRINPAILGVLMPFDCPAERGDGASCGDSCFLPVARYSTETPSNSARAIRF